MRSLRVSIVSVFLFLCACATLNKGPVPETVDIEMRGVKGEAWDTHYVSTSRIKVYTAGQLIRDRTEEADFTVRTEIGDYDPNSGLLRFKVKTVKKEGVTPLNDLAFPELNESLDFVTNRTGKVLKAGHYSNNSLFFVPSLPFPGKPVGVGDTWSLRHTWISSQNQIPLMLEAVAILKSIEHCADKSICARIEISGGVEVAAAARTSAVPLLQSQLSGEVLFDVTRSDVIWSRIVSEDQMAADTERTKVKSCMVSWRDGIKPPSSCDWIADR